MRNKIKKSFRRALLNESMDVFIDNYQGDRSLETLGEMSYFLLMDVYDNVLKANNYPDEVKNEVSHGTFAVDGVGNYHEETGIINFYLGKLNNDVAKKILSYIYYILPEYDIKLGEPTWEKHTDKGKITNSEYRVIRIPIIENNWDGGDRAPELNLANSNARYIFGDILDYQPRSYGFSDIQIPELLMKIDKAIKTVKDLNLKGGWETKGNIYKQLPSEEYVVSVLNRIKEIALWARENGYMSLSVE